MIKKECEEDEKEIDENEEFIHNQPTAKESNDAREQDRYLPIANISRIMKKVLPGNAKVTKDAKENIQECVSEFISFITSEASDKCQQEKRKTINGDDLLWAMGTLGFDKYSGPLKIYLSKYRDSVKGDKPEKKIVNKKPEGKNNNTHNTLQGNLGVIVSNIAANNNANHSKLSPMPDLSSFNPCDSNSASLLVGVGGMLVFAVLINVIIINIIIIIIIIVIIIIIIIIINFFITILIFMIIIILLLLL
jgi:nuclear transcription Y subunit beta